MLRWESGKSATMNVLVVHAMIILLTFGEPKGKIVQVYFPSLIYTTVTIFFPLVFPMMLGMNQNKLQIECSNSITQLTLMISCSKKILNCHIC